MGRCVDRWCYGVRSQISRDQSHIIDVYELSMILDTKLRVVSYVACPPLAPLERSVVFCSCPGHIRILVPGCISPFTRISALTCTRKLTLSRSSHWRIALQGPPCEAHTAQPALYGRIGHSRSLGKIHLAAHGHEGMRWCNNPRKTAADRRNVQTPTLHPHECFAA